MSNKTIAANWKMHHGPLDAKEFMEKFLSNLTDVEDVSVIFFPPAISLQAVSEKIQKHYEIKLGIQNIHWEEEGAFTGEHSAGMASSMGVGFGLIGHSERRHLFGETDIEIKGKVVAAISGGLTPVVCIGETREERLSGSTGEVIVRQLSAILPEIHQQGNGNFLLAYEPVWAIGTGTLPEAHEIEEAHSVMRDWLSDEIGPKCSSGTQLLYGGSVNQYNSRDLMSLKNVDGLLIGGASLDAVGFAKIVESAKF